MTKIVRQETHEATTLDAMRAHVLEGRKLSDKLQKRFDQLDELWKLILGNGRSFGVKLFAKRHGINVTSTYPIVRQAMRQSGWRSL